MLKASLECAEPVSYHLYFFKMILRKLLGMSHWFLKTEKKASNDISQNTKEHLIQYIVSILQLLFWFLKND